MHFFSWIVQVFSGNTGRKLYKRGKERAKKHDFKGAIEDYTTAIDSAEMPTDLQVMAHFGRAQSYVAQGNDKKGLADLKTVIGMQESPAALRTMAREAIARMEFRSRQSP